MVSGAGEIIAVSRTSWYAYTKYGYRLFNSNTFGIASKLTGNTIVRAAPSLLNNKQYLMRLGWSNIGKNGGGMIFRIGIGKRHLDFPGTFVPNNISNPIVVFLQNFKI